MTTDTQKSTWVVRTVEDITNRHQGTRIQIESGELYVFDNGDDVIAVYPRGGWSFAEKDDGRTFWVRLPSEMDIAGVTSILQANGYRPRVI